MSIPHHYVIVVEYAASPMKTELRFHDPRKADAAFEWACADPDAILVSCPNLGQIFSRSAARTFQ